MTEQKDRVLPFYFLDPTDHSVRISPVGLEVLQNPKYIIGILGKSFYENPNLDQVPYIFRTRVYNKLINWSGAQKDNGYTPQRSFAELLLLPDEKSLALGLGQKSLNLYHTAIQEIKDRFIELTAPKPD